MKEQLDLDSKIWLKSMDQSNFGADASHLVQDIGKYTETGRWRETTWARKGDKESARYTRNTMGYQVALPRREETTPAEETRLGASIHGESDAQEGGAIGSASDAIIID